MATGPTYPTNQPLYQTGVNISTATVGAERVAVDNGGAVVASLPLAAVTTDCLLATVNTNSSTSSTTLTAANLTGNYGDVIVSMTGVLAAAAVATLPTVASLVANILGAAVPNGGAFTFTLANRSSGNFAWSIAGNTGWTLLGPSANFNVPQYQYATFLLQFQSQTAATLTLINTGFCTA